MKTPIPDWMAREIAEYDLDMIPPPATILDIGANIGAFSLHYSKKWPEANILAFEPVPETFEQLKENVDGQMMVTPVPMAVRDKNGRDEIFLGDRPATSGFYQLGRQTNKVTIVDCQAAATIGSCELVKIDTEGCELEILQNLLLHNTRAIVVEYHRPADQEEIIKLLCKKGFVLFDHIPGSETHGVLKFRKIGANVHSPEKSTSPAPANKARKVYVAVAGHYTTYDLSFVQAICKMLVKPKISVQIGWAVDPSVNRARNILTANFLETDCTHLLFIDSDIGFNPDDVARVCSHDEAIVGGLYPLKRDTSEVQWCLNGLPDTKVREDGLHQVRYIGTGFMCIQREVFESMLAHEGDTISYDSDFPPHRREFAFWREASVNCRFLTEDWYFCERWNLMGGKVFADTEVVLHHAGRAQWPLALQTGNPFTQTLPLQTT